LARELSDGFSVPRSDLSFAAYKIIYTLSFQGTTSSLSLPSFLIFLHSLDYCFPPFFTIIPAFSVLSSFSIPLLWLKRPVPWSHRCYQTRFNALLVAAGRFLINFFFKTKLKAAAPVLLRHVFAVEKTKCVSLVCRILKKLLTSIASKSGRTTISETCEDCWSVSCRSFCICNQRNTSFSHKRKGQGSCVRVGARRRIYIRCGRDRP